MKKLLAILLLFSNYTKSQNLDSGYVGVQKITIQNIFQPLPGNVIIADTQTVNSWNRQWAQEPTIFYDSATNDVKIYFTGGSDSLGSTAYNNIIGVTTTTDFTNFTSPVKCFGQGLGGAALLTRARCSWVGKIGNKYYALATNGLYPLSHTGEDDNVYGYTSDDGYTWTSQGIKFNKATAWNRALLGFGNVGICVTPTNTPVVIGGKYICLIEVWGGSTWITYKAQADSLMGNWTITDSIPSLLVGVPPTASQSNLFYVNGKFYNFYGSAYGSPALGAMFYATSNDCVNWVPDTVPFMQVNATPFAHTDQVADPAVCEINSILWFAASVNQNSPTFKGQIRLWSYNNTFQNFLNQMVYQ